jgi:hypothetical protein
VTRVGRQNNLGPTILDCRLDIAERLIGWLTILALDQFLQEIDQRRTFHFKSHSYSPLDKLSDITLYAYATGIISMR